MLMFFKFLTAQEHISQYKTDKELFPYAMSLLKAVKADPDQILCSDIKTVQADNLHEFTDEQLAEVFEDFYMFSCSFVDKSKRDPANPISQCAVDLDCLKKFMDRVRKIPSGDAGDRDDWLIERMSQLFMII